MGTELKQKPKSIKKNFIYNIVYQLFILVAPLVVTPYVSRVLGAEGIGLYSYANSIVSYFLLVAVLGTATYGQRAISYVQDDREGRSRAFWEVFILRSITSCVTLAAYLIFAFFVAGAEQFIIYLILALNVINTIFDITWFMQGMEEFGKISTRSIIFRLLSIISVFVFVKSENDLWLYVLFMTAYTVLGNITMWLYLPKYLCRVRGIKPFQDIKSVLQLFIPTVAIQLYTVLDKSMIGWFSDGYAENGYYEQSEKIIKMATTAVTALGTVMIPRIAKVFKEGNIELLKNYIYKSYRFIWMLAIPITFGLIAITSFFVPVFFGAGYEKCEVLIPIFSLLAIVLGLSNVTGMQYLVPVGRQNVMTLTVVVGAVVNLVLNLILIPRFYSIGASIASVIAESCVAIVGFVYLKRKNMIELKPILTCSFKYWIAGVIMTGLLFLIKFFLPIAIWSLILLIVSGVVIYAVVLLLLRDSFALEIVKKGLQMLHRKGKTTPETVALEQSNAEKTGCQEVFSCDMPECEMERGAKQEQDESDHQLETEKKEQ